MVNPFLSCVLRHMFSLPKKSILCLELGGKAATEPGLVWFVRTALLPSLLPIQAAFSLTGDLKHSQFSLIVSCISLKRKKKGKKWSQSCILGKRIPANIEWNFLKHYLICIGFSMLQEQKCFLG